MSSSVSHDLISEQLLSFLGETFEKVQGIYLDRGTSLFETLEPISAEDASRFVAGGKSSIAGHVAHVQFYIRILRDYMNGIQHKGLDWNQSWLVKQVTEPEWDLLRHQLREDYNALVTGVRSVTEWGTEDRLGGAMAIIVHTAYHLGSIRQMVVAVRK